MEKAKTVFEPCGPIPIHLSPDTSASRSPHWDTRPKRGNSSTKMRRDSSADPYSHLLTYYGLKDYDSALEWFRRAIDDRNLDALQTARLPNAWPELQ